MVITPQLVFMVLGILAFVVSGVLAIVAVTYFFRNDIRGVMDDLSGKARRGGQRSARTAHSRGRQRLGGTPGRDLVQDAPQVRDVPGAVTQPSEDELDTVLDTKLHKVASSDEGINSSGHVVIDDIPTLVTSMADYHQGDGNLSNADEESMPTEVEGSDAELPTEVESEPSGGMVAFTVTKSILAIHSDEIITVG